MTKKNLVLASIFIFIVSGITIFYNKLKEPNYTYEDFYSIYTVLLNDVALKTII